MGKQQTRGRKEPSPVKKISEVEAAYVVQSYLKEKQFTTTLAGFQVDAATILNSLKNAPPAVRSLTSILNDFVTLREKQQLLQEQNARLEQNLKEAQQVLQQERSRMNSFVQGVHESLAVFQSGYGSPQTLPPPSMSSSPTHSAIIYQVGQSTPPAVSMDLTNTPCSVKATNSGSASNKRKNGLNRTQQEAPSNETPTTKTVSSKKARPSGQVSGAPSAGPHPSPWMCGMVRKNSTNMVRPVLPLPYQETHISTSGLKTPQAARSVPSSRNSSQFTSPSAATTKKPVSNIPASPSLDTDQRNISSSALLGETCLDTAEPSNQVPHTPARNSSVVIPLEVPVGSESPESKTDHSQLDIVSCTPPSAPEEQDQHRCKDRPAGKTALHSGSSSESTPESFKSDRTRDEFHFTKVPTKTMRPLHFRDSPRPPLVGCPTSQNSPPAMSAARSECEDATEGAQVGESSEHSTADLFLIDDILASLDDASFSSLVGDMLGADEITMNEIVSNSHAYGDVDFSNIQNVTKRSLIGDDSFGFQCLTEAASVKGIPASATEGTLQSDSSVKSGIPSDNANCCSLPPVGVLSERDPNRTLTECSPKRSSPQKQTSKREIRAKNAPRQENIPAGPIEMVERGANNLSTCSSYSP